MFLRDSEEGFQPRVLIVDDQPGNVQLLSQLLAGEGYRLFFATNGPAALDVAFKQRLDLVLLDIRMPGMNGLQVCQRLKEDSRTANIPVIFVTALDEMEDEARGLEIGAIDYITKPVSPPIVRARVRNHLELKRHRDLLESLSARDGLTGIANRRRFDDVLAAEWRRAQRNHTALALLMLDLDYFKQYNDHYGHALGDECLKQVAVALTGALERPADLMARYGGEEFVCILPDSDREGGVTIAQRIRKAVLALEIPHAYSSCARQVTVSVGVAAMRPSAAALPQELLLRADRALYRAKAEGRNRIALDEK